MGSKLYVGGLPYAATESQLTTLFAAHGTVESARVITDKFTGQSRGFGFVEMATQEEAKAAITALNGSQMDGRPLTVNEAKPQEPRTGGGAAVVVSAVVAAVAIAAGAVASNKAPTSCSCGRGASVEAPLHGYPVPCTSHSICRSERRSVCCDPTGRDLRPITPHICLSGTAVISPERCCGLVRATIGQP